MEGDKFCLKWNDYGQNIGASLRDLRDNNDFLDLTLACDDAQVGEWIVSVMNKWKPVWDMGKMDLHKWEQESLIHEDVVK